jgi:ABC-type Fe3+/spermidine/putrescine transport system ATPase subunit
MESEESFSKIEGKDIFLPLGCTGAGKTTSLQFLCGVELEKQEIVLEKGGVLTHYAVKNYPESFDSVLT